jgi:hypothetical protein
MKVPDTHYVFATPPPTPTLQVMPVYVSVHYDICNVD